MLLLARQVFTLFETHLRRDRKLHQVMKSAFTGTIVRPSSSSLSEKNSSSSSSSPYAMMRIPIGLWRQLIVHTFWVDMMRTIARQCFKFCVTVQSLHPRPRHRNSLLILEGIAAASSAPLEDDDRDDSWSRLEEQQQKKISRCSVVKSVNNNVVVNVKSCDFGWAKH
jgi:hypothetical protein